MADFTATSSANSAEDGSISVGVETWFSAEDTADRTWTLTVPAPDVEFWGTIAMRSQGKADILVRIWLDGRLVLNANLKTQDGGPASRNIWAHVPPLALQEPASNLRIYIGAAGAGNAWPVNCEIELSGRWE